MPGDIEVSASSRTSPWSGTALRISSTYSAGWQRVITSRVAAGACLLLFSGVRFTLSYGLIALALSVAVTNGLFDYHTALVRACFDDRLFARLALVKNGVAFALMGGGAFLFGSAKMTLVGTIISLGGSVVTARAALRKLLVLKPGRAYCQPCLSPV